MVTQAASVEAFTHLTYDQSGRMLSQTDPDGVSRHYAWNARNQASQIADSLGNSTNYRYDAAGNLTKVILPLGNTYTFTYNKGNQQTGQTPPLGGTVAYAYDANGNLISRKNALGNVWRFGYDTADRLISRTAPGGHALTLHYNADGQLSSLSLPTGKSQSFTRDVIGELTAVSYSDSTPPVSYTYDADGNTTRIVDGTGTTTQTLDSLNQPIRIQTHTGTFTYTYAPSELPQSETLPDSTLRSFSYDAANHLTTVADTTGTYARTLDAAGRVTAMNYPSGASQIYTYDGDGRLASLTAKNTSGTLYTYSQGYDADGRIISQAGPDGTHLYTYDADSRLTRECFSSPCGTTVTSYTYNNASQRLTKTDATGTTNYTYDPASELTSVTNPDSSTTTISHDALGDITGIGADSYTFNAAGEQASSTVGGTHTTRTYDYLGQIASQKTGTAAASIFKWDDGPVGTALAFQGSSRLVSFGGSPVGFSSGGAQYEYLKDPRGSVAEVVDSTGAPQWQFGYDAFGITRLSQKLSTGAPSVSRGFLGALHGASADSVIRRGSDYLPRFNVSLAGPTSVFILKGSHPTCTSSNAGILSSVCGGKNCFSDPTRSCTIDTGGECSITSNFCQPGPVDCSQETHTTNPTCWPEWGGGGGGPGGCQGETCGPPGGCDPSSPDCGPTCDPSTADCSCDTGSASAVADCNTSGCTTSVTMNSDGSTNINQSCNCPAGTSPSTSTSTNSTGGTTTTTTCIPGSSGGGSSGSGSGGSDPGGLGKDVCNSALAFLCSKLGFTPLGGLCALTSPAVCWIVTNQIPPADGNWFFMSPAGP